MAYSNFIPEVWTEGIERELERLCVFVEDCNRSYEGQVKKCGDKVNISSIGRPTIRTLARNAADGSITTAETLADNTVQLVIDQIRYFNVKVGDIDEAQAKGDIMSAIKGETAEGLAHAMDTYVADFAKSTGVNKLHAAGSELTLSTSNILSELDDAITFLYEHDVPSTAEIVAVLTPRAYQYFKNAYISSDTNNSEYMKNGKVAKYGNVQIKMSNAVAKDAGNVYYMMVRTKKAIAFVNPLTHVEAYRPDDAFVDALKGYVLFGGKIVRNNEMVIMNDK